MFKYYKTIDEVLNFEDFDFETFYDDIKDITIVEGEYLGAYTPIGVAALKIEIWLLRLPEFDGYGAISKQSYPEVFCRIREKLARILMSLDA